MKGCGNLPRLKQPKTGNEPLPANQQKGEKKCNFCHETKKVTSFYISKNPLHSADERVPICKDCVMKASLNEDGTINDIEFNKILKAIDRPYYKDLIESSIQSFMREHSYVEEDKVQYYGKEILQKYFTLIAMRQDRNKSYEDSEREGFVHRTSNIPKSTKERIAQKYADITDVDENGDVIDKDNKKIKSDVGDFEITKEIIDLFGDGYSKAEYKKMHEKYEKLKLNYTLQTNLHQEALATYVRFKVKEEIATAEGNVDEARKWYESAQNAATNGKLTPKALSAADLQKGMNSVCELVKAVEQATDVVKILPQFKYRPNDSVDFTIMCYINYERKLNGQPEVPYEEVYSFYDKKVQEYVKQNGDPYGIFVNDPTVKNRDTVKTFLKMPDDYDELSGDADE